MSKKKPLALKKGDTIGIMAPSSTLSEDHIAKTIIMLKDRGYKVFVHPQTFATLGPSAGTPQEKAAAIADLYRDPTIKAIFLARGGNRAGAVLPYLDYRLIKKNPKIIMGYSDATVLLNTIQKKAGVITFHGPVAKDMTKWDDAQLKQCFNLLQGKPSDMPLKDAAILQRGDASGKLIGGNLSLIISLLGTPYEPDFKGALLFLEDCNDEKSRIDRMFIHLANAGVFKKINGLILGTFSNLTDSGAPFTLSFEDIVNEAVGSAHIPVIMDAPFGHGKDLYTLPVGAEARLSATRKGQAKLRLDGPAVTL